MKRLTRYPQAGASPASRAATGSGVANRVAMWPGLDWAPMSAGKAGMAGGHANVFATRTGPLETPI
jgi:hypothetical protein